MIAAGAWTSSLLLPNAPIPFRLTPLLVCAFFWRVKTTEEAKRWQSNSNEALANGPVTPTPNLVAKHEGLTDGYYMVAGVEDPGLIKVIMGTICVGS